MQNEHRVEAVLKQLQPSYVAGEKKLVDVHKENGVGYLVLNNPPVNSFSMKLRDSLKDAYNDVDTDPNVKAIVITGGKTPFFMAGADIPELQKMLGSTTELVAKFTKEGNDLYNMIESGSKPTVAAVNGTALGGGLELAMACNARIGLPHSIYGLPELSLGLLPGLGGTQRLPRLIGVKAAVNATLKDKKIKAKEALKIGLIDQIVKKPEELMAAATKLALEIAAGKKPRRKSLYLTDKIRDFSDETIEIEKARVGIAKKHKNVEHPFHFLTAVLHGVQHGGVQGLLKEGEVFEKCLHATAASALIHMFFSSREVFKVPGISPKEGKKRVKRVAVLGGGTMGSGIALVYLMKGCEVILKEVNEKYLNVAVERIADTVNRVLKARRMPPIAIESILRGLTPQITYDGFDKCDLVVEAVVENLKVKREIFQTLEKVCNPQCILATNTSSINIEDIGSVTNCQDRILGLHFFSPAHIMPLLEIVRTKHTSNATLATSVNMGKQIGKTVVVVGNCVGFTANRIFAPYGQAACLLADSGVHPYKLDAAVKNFGMPMGPFTMSDLSGVDIQVHVGEIISNGYPEYSYVSQLPTLLLAAKRLGQKSQAGYYKYVRNKAVPDFKGLQPFLDQSIAKNNGVGLKLTGKETDQDLVEMVMFPVVNESCRVIAEGHVLRECDVDVTSVTGYAFPAWRGGVMHWARSQPGGLARVAERLKYFAEVCSGGNEKLKKFYSPCDYLKQQA